MKTQFFPASSELVSAAKAAAKPLAERLFNLSEKQRTLISNGASVECGQAEPGTVYRLYLENEFMGLALRDDSGLHITVWFGKEK